MIKIVIASPLLRELKGISKTNKPYHMRIQTAHAYVVDADGAVCDFPDKFEIALEADQVPYPRSNYTLQPSSLQVSRDGRLEVRARLAPVAIAKA